MEAVYPNANFLSKVEYYQRLRSLIDYKRTVEKDFSILGLSKVLEINYSRLRKFADGLDVLSAYEAFQLTTFLEITNEEIILNKPKD